MPDSVSPTSTVPHTPDIPLPSPVARRRESTAFDFDVSHWSVAMERDVESGIGPSNANLGILAGHVAISAPRSRSVSPLPPTPSAPTLRPLLRRAVSSYSYAPAPSPLPPPPQDNMPSTLALESEALTRLVDESNAFVAALMIRVNTLHQAAGAFKENATFEQLTALFSTRPEFRSLETARCVGLNLPLSVWRNLVRSTLEANASRYSNTTGDEQAPGRDLLDGALYWRARQESEALGLIRINQRRGSSQSESSTRRSSSATSASQPMRRGSVGPELNMTRRASGLSIEQHLPPTAE